MQKNKINDWMIQSQLDRQQHINLSTECTFHIFLKDYKNKQIGDLYCRSAQIREARKRLLDFHNIEDFTGREFQICHKCTNNSCSNNICINPLHCYWGTASENIMDKPKQQRQNMARLGMLSQIENHNSNNQKVITCHICLKTGQSRIMKRWHGDNCKYKKL